MKTFTKIKSFDSIIELEEFTHNNLIQGVNIKTHKVLSYRVDGSIYHEKTQYILMYNTI